MTNATLPADAGADAGGPPGAWKRIVQGIRDLRDALIVVTTSAYLLGYLSWALFAWAHELGLIPALDAQYFLAGIFPTVVVAAFCGFVWALFAVVQWLASAPTEKQKQAGKVLGACGGVMVVLSVIGGFTLPTQLSPLVVVLLFVGAAFLVAEGFFDRGKWVRYYHYFQLSALSIAVVCLALFLISRYATEWFPGLPHEFGGPSARLVQFDLDLAQLSKPTRATLMPEAPPGEVTGVHRTRNLYLVFDGNDFVLVSTSDSLDRVYKIRKSAVNAVFLGSDSTPAHK